MHVPTGPMVSCWIVIFLLLTDAEHYRRVIGGGDESNLRDC